MEKIKIENEKNIYRDMNSNALLFEDYKETHYERRRRIHEEQEKEINNLKQEILEIKATMSKILNILEK